jgi:RNA polymerase sigma factor (sigma-70 family)
MELEELINGCIKGNELARKHLYLNYGPTIKSVCRRYIKDSSEALDVFHDCFIKLLHSIEKYKYNGSFDAWIKRLSINFCLDKLKKYNPIIYHEEYVELLDDEAEELKENSLSVNDAIKADFSKDDWNTMINKLPEHYRVVFCLYQLDNFTHADIAKELAIKEKTSRSRLSKAKKQLRVIIDTETKLKLAIG